MADKPKFALIDNPFQQIVNVHWGSAPSAVMLMFYDKDYNGTSNVAIVGGEGLIASAISMPTPPYDPYGYGVSAFWFVNLTKFAIGKTKIVCTIGGGPGESGSTWQTDTGEQFFMDAGDPLFPGGPVYAGESVGMGVWRDTFSGSGHRNLEAPTTIVSADDEHRPVTGWFLLPDTVGQTTSFITMAINNGRVELFSQAQFDANLIRTSQDPPIVPIWPNKSTRPGVVQDFASTFAQSWNKDPNPLCRTLPPPTFVMGRGGIVERKSLLRATTHSFPITDRTGSRGDADCFNRERSGALEMTYTLQDNWMKDDTFEGAKYDGWFDFWDGPATDLLDYKRVICGGG